MDNRDSRVAAKIEAMAEADAHLTNAGMPAASEMIVALEKAWKYLNHPGGATGTDWFAACEAVRDCLKQSRA